MKRPVYIYIYIYILTHTHTHTQYKGKTRAFFHRFKLLDNATDVCKQWDQTVDHLTVPVHTPRKTERNPEEKHRPPRTLANKQTGGNHEGSETIHNLYRINRLWLTINKAGIKKVMNNVKWHSEGCFLMYSQITSACSITQCNGACFNKIKKYNILHITTGVGNNTLQLSLTIDTRWTDY